MGAEVVASCLPVVVTRLSAGWVVVVVDTFTVDGGSGSVDDIGVVGDGEAVVTRVRGRRVVVTVVVAFLVVNEVVGAEEEVDGCRVV